MADFCFFCARNCPRAGADNCPSYAPDARKQPSEKFPGDGAPLDHISALLLEA